MAKSKATAEMITIDDAITSAYAELALIARELGDWISKASPVWRPDNRVSTQYLQMVYDDLCKVGPAPDLSELPAELRKREVCVIAETSSKSRETKRRNALAKLRPAAAVLRKTPFTALAEKISNDIHAATYVFRIPGAYEKS
jgi:hypothetical protein